MAYERTTDTSKADQNTKLLADSLDAAVNGAVTLYNNQVSAQDAEQENNFQALVAAGNMSLADQLAYRKTQLAGTKDSATRASIRTSIATLNAQISQKNFSDAYTVQLQQNAAGIESVESVISWLQSQLVGATDQTVISKIQSELVTQNGNLFTAQQKTLSDQTTYAKNSGNISTINNQITSLQTAKGKALLSGDTDTAATLDLQIQSLQSYLAINNITTTMQNLATSTATGASSASNLLNAYQTQISGADTTTPITINGTTYPSAQAFWTATRDSYVADTSSSGFFSRVTKESTDAINVAASNNTISLDNIKAINSQFATLSANPVLAPFAVQLATSKQAALQTAADALSQVIENNFDQSLDLNTALTALQAIAAQGVNVDSTTQKILNSAAQTQSQAVQAIMSAANNLIAANPGMSITTAVTQAVASGAGAIIPNKDLLSSTPAATAEDQLNKDTIGTQPNPTSTTVTPPATTPTGTPPVTATTNQPATQTSYTIKYGDTLSKIAAANNTTVAAIAAANNISNPDVIQAGATIVIPSAAPAPTTQQTPPPGSSTASPSAAYTAGASTIAPTAQAPSTSTASQPIDFTLHNGETIAQYTARIAAARALQPASTTTPTTTTPPPTTTPAPTTSPAPTSTTPAPTSSTSAPSILRSSDPYNPPSGLTQTKTAGGGTGYSDKDGNIYAQTTPGVYTLLPK